MFPIEVTDATGGDAEAALPTDETWTRKWGPIRADRYRIVRALASGAQGKILLAHHRFLDQPCVIKLVDAADDEWADVANQRLRLEAQAGIRVNHPHVARVYDCDCVDRAWYFVMEYIAGDNLRRIIRQVRRFTWNQVVEIGRQVASGLAAIHRAGLVHRDIKPGNIMLARDGAAKIMDLGLVKVPRNHEALGVTWVGQAVGTPLYMPPEQFQSDEQIDARADIYALGATLFHLLTGRSPFDGADLEHLAQLHRSAPVVWKDEDRKDVPRWLREAIETCLAKRREHRFESAESLERALVDRQSPSHRPTHHEPAASRGVVIPAFQNLSRRPEDAWIGDAIAEYLSSRMMEFDGVHVADRNVFAGIMAKGAQDESDQEDEPGRTQMIHAARLVGVSYVILGNFHRQGKNIRIIAHAMVRDSAETRHLGSVSGPVTALFELEDELTDKMIEKLGPELAPARHRGSIGGSTTNLEAHEKYIHGQRAFADGDYATAIDYARQANTLDPDYGDPLSMMGAAFARLGDYEQAVECHERQERLARERSDPGQLAVALGNLGAMYYYKGEYPVAYEFLERAAEISEDNGPTADAAKLHGNLGMVLMRLERWHEAERAFEQAVTICKQRDDLASMVWPYNGMGSVLLKQGRVAEAREYHQRALGLAEELGDRVMVGISQMNLGRCACLADDYVAAERCFEDALAALQRTRFWNGLALVYEHMAEMYLRQGRAERALETIGERIEVACRHGNRRMEAEAWEQKARAFEMLNRTDEAIKALKKSFEIAQRPGPHQSLHRYLEEVTSRTAFR